MKVLAIFSILFLIHQTASIPSDPSTFNYVSTASQIIATNLLKHYKNDENNNVFSPLAVTDILAILAEGSEGETFEEFSHALGFPKKKSDLRSCFRDTLKTFVKNDNFDLEKAPSFSTWFYVYKNHTVRKEYKDILSTFYNVHVKEIARTIYDWDEVDTSLKTSTTPTPMESTTHHNDRDIADFEVLKHLPAEEEIEFPEKPSKFDSNVEEKEYVEVNVIREHQTTITPETLKNEIVQQREEENEISDTEKGVAVLKALKFKDIKAKKTSRSLVAGLRSLFNKDDVVSSLSANSITGRETGSKSKMLLFNGLYFRSNWAYPFQELRSTPKDVFNITPEKSIMVTLMRTAGKFNYMYCEDLSAEVIDFPYESNNYSMLVFVPKEDIKTLIEKLEPVDLQNIRKNLKPKDLFISLPKFQIEQTCRSEEVLKSQGLKTLFSRKESQLTLISEDNDLHVDEVVQYTNMQVDEGACSENAITGSNSKQFRNIEETEIKINKPFLYFVINSENVVLVSGKVMNPKYKQIENVDLDVEFTLS